MLDVDEMESLYKQVCDKLREKMFLYNRDVDSNALLEYLKDIGMEDVLNITPHYETYKQGKIVIIGQSSVEKNIIYAIIKELGIDKSRVELCLEYDDAKTFNFKKLRYNPSYRVVLVGAMPHSSSGKVDHSSAISKMEQEEGYPRVVRLTANEKLKITKTNLKETLKNLLNENYL